MPTLANMEIPPPKCWDEFQDITLSALKLRWKSVNLQQNGRLGQEQAGVDIFGPDDLDRRVGVQCKKTTGELEPKTVLEEVAKAERFQPPLEAFFIATTGRRDAKIQAAVRLLTEKRHTAGSFPVGVLFWDDLVQDLVTNPAEFKKHYPQIPLADFARGESGFSLLCALDVAYWGLGIKQTMGLVFGEMGQLANEEPHQIDRLLRSVEAAAQVFMNSIDHAEIVECSRSLATACHAAIRAGDWDSANGLATKVEAIVEAIEYRISGRALAAFTLGKVLRVWDINLLENKPAPTKLEDDVLRSLRALAADDEPWTAIALVGGVQEIVRQSAEDGPHLAYNHVRKYLLNEGIG